MSEPVHRAALKVHQPRRMRRDFILFTSHGMFMAAGSTLAKACKEAEPAARAAGMLPEGEELEIYGALERTSVPLPTAEGGRYQVVVMSFKYPATEAPEA